MSEAVSVRVATAADHPALCAILDALDEVHSEGAPSVFVRPSLQPRPVEYFTEFFRGETSAALVADVGRVIGVALVLLKQSPEFPVFRPLSYGVIDAIAVDAGWRRRGAGRALVAAATAWAESRGAAWLELGVYEFNRDALAFYDALGFQTASRKLRRPLRGSGPEGERLE